MARAPVSKTGGCRFESCHSCQGGPDMRLDNECKSEQMSDQAPAEVRRKRVSPFRFLQEVREETRKVTWPSRRETAITTAMVFVMVAIASVFFLVADQLIRIAVTFVLGIGT